MCLPLGSGFITGTINKNTKLAENDFCRFNPRFQPDALKANQAVVDLLNRVAKQKNATPAQIALAWLLAQKPRIVPLLQGTTRLQRLKENPGAAAIELTNEDLQQINDAASKI